MTTTYTLDYSGLEVDNAIEIVQDSIASNYSSSSTYQINDFVLYDNKLYRCGTVITTPEAWNAAKWIETKLGQEFNKCDTAAHWNAATIVPEIGEIIIYLDTPGLKVGNGVHLPKDLDFIVGNVTAEEKAAWNNKVRCYLDETDVNTLVFTTN